jgi:hypothetical protein
MHIIIKGDFALGGAVRFCGPFDTLEEAWQHIRAEGWGFNDPGTFAAVHFVDAPQRHYEVKGRLPGEKEMRVLIVKAHSQSEAEDTGREMLTNMIDLDGLVTIAEVTEVEP